MATPKPPIDVHTLTTQVEHFIAMDLHPIMLIIMDISRIIGIFLIMMGIVRLMRHAHHDMMHRVSPAGTVMYFVAGTTLAAFTPEITALSTSLFNGLGAGNVITTYGQGQMNDCVMQNAKSAAHQSAAQYPTCPVMAYYQQLLHPKSALDTKTVMRTMMFAVMFVMGVLSFLRGVTMLIHVGEGGQGGVMGKAVTHIAAGVVGVNAGLVYTFLQSVYHSTIAT